ncbi:hypothetical protein FNL56_16260 [Tardiphaga sp. vice304]|uniref:hypothetical protein n=1 Tax=Tardiphaga sp. vice304 TaxID=2592817 RepID=UPI001163A770|nr:hypothetical protein [Tardiphaga sp. vice304]QDM27499.1 hypothetical protein FNL56_16260 [Tardiphaga sp. vice304]
MTQADSVHSTLPTNTSVLPPASNSPASPVQGLYYPTPVTPEDAFKAIGRLRRAARDEIDRLLAFLDQTDPYMFFELEDAVDDGACDEDELDGVNAHLHGEGEDDEEADPSGDEASGIADMDGLAEQVGGHYGRSGEVL